MPSVDVIIPSYNGMPYLKEALQSVLNQSHTDLNIYVIDDGSDDGKRTEKYVKSIKDHRVHYKYKPNGGRSSARNFGVSLSGSEYIAFLDADDLWHKNKIKDQLKLFETNPDLGLAYGQSYVIDSSGRRIGKTVYERRGDLFRYLLSGNRISGSASMVLTKRSVIQRVGGFREDSHMGEDWELWLRIARKYSIDYVPAFLVSVRLLNTETQTNNLRSARGMDHIFSVIVKEFDLGLFDRARVARVCLKNASLGYFNGRDLLKARQTFFLLVKYNPLAILTTNPNEWFAYARITFGNERLRRFRRKVSSKYRSKETRGN